MNEIEELKYHVRIFRSAIEYVISEYEIPKAIRWISNFPTGCCYEMSCLLGKYLDENEFRTQLVSGQKKYENVNCGFNIPATHSWLEYKGANFKMLSNAYEYTRNYA